ncbi:MAG: hypothetical protein EZS28_026566, partial [Streblomastix strix]
ESTDDEFDQQNEDDDKDFEHILTWHPKDEKDKDEFVAEKLIKIFDRPGGQYSENIDKRNLYSPSNFIGQKSVQKSISSIPFTLKEDQQSSSNEGNNDNRISKDEETDSEDRNDAEQLNKEPSKKKRQRKEVRLERKQGRKAIQQAQLEQMNQFMQMNNEPDNMMYEINAKKKKKNKKKPHSQGASTKLKKPRLDYEDQINDIDIEDDRREMKIDKESKNEQQEINQSNQSSQIQWVMQDKDKSNLPLLFDTPPNSSDLHLKSPDGGNNLLRISNPPPVHRLGDSFTQLQFAQNKMTWENQYPNHLQRKISGVSILELPSPGFVFQSDKNHYNSNSQDEGGQININSQSGSNSSSKSDLSSNSNNNIDMRNDSENFTSQSFTPPKQFIRIPPSEPKNNYLTSPQFSPYESRTSHQQIFNQIRNINTLEKPTKLAPKPNTKQFLLLPSQESPHVLDESVQMSQVSSNTPLQNKHIHLSAHAPLSSHSAAHRRIGSDLHDITSKQTLYIPHIYSHNKLQTQNVDMTGLRSEIQHSSPIQAIMGIQQLLDASQTQMINNTTDIQSPPNIQQ